MSVPPLRLLAIVLLLASVSAAARTRLLALPARSQVMVALDRSSAALIEEQRQIALTAGRNEVDFSWGHSQIDPDSLILQLLPSSPGQPATAAEILSISLPPGENTVIWTLQAARSGPVRVRISYRLQGLEHQFYYRAISDPGEHHLSLDQFLRLANRTPDRYPEAHILPAIGAPLIRSLEPAETLDVRLAHYPELPLTVAYSADPVRYGYLDRSQNQLNVPVHWVLVNDRQHGFGGTALAAGKVRLFQRTDPGDDTFLGEDRIGTTAAGKRLRLELGLARDIVVKRQVIAQQRQRIVGNLYRDSATLRYQIDNFKDTPVTLDLIEHPRAIRDQLFGSHPRPPEWTLGAATTLPQPPDPDRSNQQRLVFHLQLPAHDPDKPEPLVYQLQLDFANEW